MKPTLVLLLTLLVAGAALANPKPVRVVWDPPTPEDAPHVEGYNVYSVAIEPPLKPADYEVNLVSPLPPAYSLTARPLPTPSSHDPRTRPQRRLPKANSYQKECTSGALLYYL